MSVAPQEPEKKQEPDKKDDKKPALLWNNLGALLLNLGLAGGTLAWVEMASKLPPEVALPVQIACAGLATMAVVQFGYNMARVSQTVTKSDLERIAQEEKLRRAQSQTELTEEENKRLRAEIAQQELKQRLDQLKSAEAVATNQAVSGSENRRTYAPPEIEEQPVQQIGQRKDV